MIKTSLIAASSLLIASCLCLIFTAASAQTSPPLVGGDRDAKGCIGSAGYSWCAKTNQCERPWGLAKAKGFRNSQRAFTRYCRAK